jgi:hypothetical protein
MWYRVVRAFMLLVREKYLLEKFIISLHVNASAIQPSTLALLHIFGTKIIGAPHGDALGWIYVTPGVTVAATGHLQ